MSHGHWYKVYTLYGQYFDCPAARSQICVPVPYSLLVGYAYAVSLMKVLFVTNNISFAHKKSAQETLALFYALFITFNFYNPMQELYRLKGVYT